MKNNYIQRFFAVVLVFVMAVSMLPFAAVTASAKEYISGSFIKDEYTRKGESAHIFEFDSVQKDCYGFTLFFTVDKVSKGSVTGDFNFEVCVRNTSGDWTVAEMFWLEKDDIGKEQKITVGFKDAMDVDQMAILCRSDKAYTYTYTIRLEDPMDSPNYGYWGIKGKFSDKKFTKEKRHTYPLVLDEPIYDCHGFSLHYHLIEVKEGIMDWDTVYEVYVRDTAGKWHCVYEFNLPGDEMSYDINWGSPVDVEQVAVLAKASGTYSYDAFFALSDAVYEDDDSSQTQSGFSGYLSGYWSDTPFKRSGNTTYPFVLNSQLKKCKGFSLDYEITNVSDGKMKSNSKFAVYVCSSDGTWTKAGEFSLKDYEASVNIKLKKATTVTKVAIQCMNSGNFSYYHSLGIYDPVY